MLYKFCCWNPFFGNAKIWKRHQLGEWVETVRERNSLKVVVIPKAGSCGRTGKFSNSVFEMSIEPWGNRCVHPGIKMSWSELSFSPNFLEEFLSDEEACVQQFKRPLQTEESSPFLPFPNSVSAFYPPFIRFKDEQQLQDITSCVLWVDGDTGCRWLGRFINSWQLFLLLFGRVGSSVKNNAGPIGPEGQTGPDKAFKVNFSNEQSATPKSRKVERKLEFSLNTR